MPLQATSGAASYDGFGGGPAAVPNYIEECFATHLYTGNGSTQTITNGIDLSTKGGLVWLKGRSGVTDHALYDTARGATFDLASNTTAAQTTQSTGLTSFGTTGFSIGALAKINTNAATYVSWTFRKQPKFFDVVTYTGNGNATRSISHNLGSVPGCVIIKTTNTTSNWTVWHQSTPVANDRLFLNSSVPASGSANADWGATPSFTSSSFTVGSTSGTSGTTNVTGNTYVAYVFAHNAGGFGLTGTDNVISCGSWTGTPFNINLGWEPQWVLIKKTNDTGGWLMFDTMRGWDTSGVVGGTQLLQANTSGAEGATGLTTWQPNATGFSGNANVGDTYIYIAIRRGPMKTPTTGTSVFSPNTFTTNDQKQTTNFPVDMLMGGARAGGGNWAAVVSRLQGLNTTNVSGSGYPRLITSSTSAELSGTNVYYSYDNTGYLSGGLTGSTDNVAWSFRRAPGFFDVVCYTGTFSDNRQVPHNLGVTPEIIFVKSRNNNGDLGGGTWYVWNKTIAASGGLTLNTSNAVGAFDWRPNGDAPTSSYFMVSAGYGTNGQTTATYVAYLFASCPGVSKVGSYTGTGATLQIDCGFTSGARFVLIKRTDSTGDWYCWDSSRGIVSGNDSYLVLNSTAAEVTNTDWVDTYSAGFELSNAAGNNVNINGASYIFLSVA